VKILFVLPYVPSLIRVRPYHLIRELAARHEVRVLAAGGPGEGAGRRPTTECGDLEVVPISRAASLRSCAVAALRGEPLQAAVCRSPELSTRLRALVTSERFDLVHFEHLRSVGLSTALAGQLPLVFDAVDCISLLLERTLHGSHSLVQRVIAALELDRTRAFEAKLLARFDAVTVTAPEDQAALRALAPTARISLVPNGVDLEHFQPRPGQPEAATLVFSGKMSYHATATAVLSFVQRVLPRIRLARPDVQLRIVGSDPPRCIRALASDPAIAVTGRVADLPAAVGNAAIAVCPMTVKVGIQNKVLEAMALGLPVVASPLGATGLAAQPERDLLVGQDDDHFAAQVLRLMGDAELRRRVGQAGRHYVETTHRWSTEAERLEQLYRDACAAHRPRLTGEAVALPA
jgi:glycosyltransferase involved in cell wall biosynthesis